MLSFGISPVNFSDFDLTNDSEYDINHLVKITSKLKLTKKRLRNRFNFIHT